MLHVNITCMNHHTIRIGHGIVAFFPWRNSGPGPGYFHLLSSVLSCLRWTDFFSKRCWSPGIHSTSELSSKRKKNMDTHGWKDGNQTNLCWKIMLNISWKNHHFMYIYIHMYIHVHSVIEIYLYTWYNTLLHIHQVLAWWTWQIYSL